MNVTAWELADMLKGYAYSVEAMSSMRPKDIVFKKGNIYKAKVKKNILSIRTVQGILYASTKTTFDGKGIVTDLPLIFPTHMFIRFRNDTNR